MRLLEVLVHLAQCVLIHIFFVYCAFDFSSILLSQSQGRLEPENTSSADHRETLSIALHQLHERQLEKFMDDTWAASNPRYLVWRESGLGEGWGNHIRSIASAFLLALVTRRRFMIDHERFFQVFLNPLSGNATINYREDASLMQMQEQLLPLDIPSMLLTARSTANVVSLKCNCHFLLELLENSDRDLQLFKDLFGSTREDAVVEVAMRLLLRRPQPEVGANALRVLSSWKHESYDGFAMVQSRQWIDLPKEARPPAVDELSCTVMRLKKYRSELPGKKRLLVAVTSDSTTHAEMLSQQLSSLGDIVVNKIFTNNLHTASSLLDTLANAQSTLDWYLLGQADFVICTGSTYCISARARLGFGNNGSFPYVSERWTYRHGGRQCTKDVNLLGWRGLDTLSDASSGNIGW